MENMFDDVVEDYVKDAEDMEENGSSFEIKEYDNSNVYKNNVYISNSFARSMEKTNLLEGKIELLAIHHLNNQVMINKKRDSNGNEYTTKYVCLTAKEIQELIGRDHGNTYSEIHNAALSMKNKLLIVEDKERECFVMRSMYGDIAYKNGKLLIEFNPDMEEMFLGLSKNFTKLSLPLMFSFKKNGGFQLYKMLKSYAFPKNLPDIDLTVSQEELPTFAVTYSLSQLRMMLGYVDLSERDLQKEGSKDHPNFEKMSDLEKNPKYKRWSDFYFRVIKPGQIEINEISDIYIQEVKKERRGKGGKITDITFVIQWNREYFLNRHNKKKKKPAAEQKKEEDVEELTLGMLDDFVDELRPVFAEYSFKTKELRQIATESGCNMEKVKKAKKVIENASSDIRDVLMYLLKAIRENYEPPVKKKAENYRKVKQNFEEREYSADDMVAIEKALLKKK